MKPQHHGPTPFVALVAGVSYALWLVVSAGLTTAAAHPVRLSEPPAVLATLTAEAAPMPTAGVDLTVSDVVR